MGAAAGSVRSNPVTQPPTNAIWPSKGCNLAAAAARRARFGFCCHVFTLSQFSRSTHRRQFLSLSPVLREWHLREQEVHRVWGLATRLAERSCREERTQCRATSLLGKARQVVKENPVGSAGREDG